ncbi:unnamed protein product [Acanthoscelides obtectus]|uniref:Uncharacterized protein n=1 Tax=Acanthoscelides obtectus TaxID=200917 RepID=A0A9P0MJ60_ACAOB|nr:unnamed protein product [Acanthoscelides obtectus]CAK1663648.1 hypothetical protein AOBTE_LOCUS23771 [Acanthoscelides obtectus]
MQTIWIAIFQEFRYSSHPYKLPRSYFKHC